MLYSLRYAYRSYLFRPCKCPVGNACHRICLSSILHRSRNNNVTFIAIFRIRYFFALVVIYIFYRRHFILLIGIDDHRLTINNRIVNAVLLKGMYPTDTQYQTDD